MIHEKTENADQKPTISAAKKPLMLPSMMVAKNNLLLDGLVSDSEATAALLYNTLIGFVYHACGSDVKDNVALGHVQVGFDAALKAISEATGLAIPPVLAEFMEPENRPQEVGTDG